MIQNMYLNGLKINRSAPTELHKAKQKQIAMNSFTSTRQKLSENNINQ